MASLILQWIMSADLYKKWGGMHMNPIKKWNQLGLFTRIMVGFVLGIAAGLILGEKATKLAFLGTILTRLLTMVVAPLVLGLLICSAADVKDFKTLGKIGGKTLAIFLGGTAVAVAIGLVLCNIMQIGAGFVMESAEAYDAKEIPSIVDTLMDIIPTNPFNSLSTQNLLQCGNHSAELKMYQKTGCQR